MGYEVYITRARRWLEHEQHAIPSHVWDDVVAADPTLQVSTSDYYERRTAQGGRERFHPVIWTHHPDLVPFWFIDGAIHTKSPDVPTIEKMVELAEQLQARVLDENNREYLRGGVSVPETWAGPAEPGAAADGPRP